MIFVIQMTFVELDSKCKFRNDDRKTVELAAVSAEVQELSPFLVQGRNDSNKQLNTSHHN